MLAGRDKTKYNYLQDSFQKQLQRSYNRGSSPDQPHSPEPRTPAYPQHPRSSAPRSSQFSPYENRQENARDRLMLQQLQNHNRVLAEQLGKYKVMVEQMQSELRVRAQEYKSLEALRQKERHLHEQAEGEMREEIGLLLTKNGYLEDRAQGLERQLRAVQSQLAQNQVRARSVSAAVKDTSSKTLQQIWSLLGGELGSRLDKSRDNTGRQLNQTFSNIQSTNLSPRNSQSNGVVEQVQNLLKRLRKYEQLKQSILEMQAKISGKRISSDGQELKNVWKWLKELGHQFNIAQKWKMMLAELLGLDRGGEELSLDQVLQKTVLRLHGSDNN